SGPAGARRRRRNGDLVAVLQERSGRAIRKHEGVGSVPGQLDQGAALVSVRSAYRARRIEITGPDVRSVDGQVSELLRARPIHTSEGGPADQCPVDEDLEGDVETPRVHGTQATGVVAGPPALHATEVGEGFGFARGRRLRRRLQRRQRDNPRRNRGEERL